MSDINLSYGANYDQLMQLALLDSKRISGFKPALREKLQIMFKQQVEQKWTELEEAVVQQNNIALKETAHYLKGCGLEIGAARFAQISAVLQQKGEASHFDELSDWMTFLQDTFQKTLSAFLE